MQKENTQCMTVELCQHNYRKDIKIKVCRRTRVVVNIWRERKGKRKVKANKQV